MGTSSSCMHLTPYVSPIHLPSISHPSPFHLPSISLPSPIHLPSISHPSPIYLPGEVLDAHIEQLLTELFSYYSSSGWLGSNTNKAVLHLLNKVSVEALQLHVSKLVAVCTAESTILRHESTNKALFCWTCFEQLKRLDCRAHLDRLAPVILRTYLEGEFAVPGHGVWWENKTETFQAMEAVVETPETLATQTALILGYLFTEPLLLSARKGGLDTIINETGLTASVHRYMGSKDVAQLVDRVCRLLSLAPSSSLQPHAAVLVWLLGELQGKAQATIYKQVTAMAAQSFGSDARLVLRCVRSRYVSPSISRHLPKCMHLAFPRPCLDPLALTIT